jgi:hypothetical protein
MSPSEQTRREFLSTASALGVVGALDASLAASADAPPEGIGAPAWYYQHFDADYSLDVPEEGFGGWKREQLVISAAHTGVVLMHAWDAGTQQQFPGWHRVVPYIPRADAICRDVLPKLLDAVRDSGLPLFHVVGGGSYGRDLPGYKHAVELAGPEPAPLPQVESDPGLEKLTAFKKARGFPGTHNLEDIDKGFARLDFAPGTRPLDHEGVAENGPQLFALCKEKGVNHLIYAGFAINWCLLLSPGGMAEMQRYGVMCSALRQATTAVENKESARREWCKELGLWRVALAFGFVFDVDDFVAALKTGPRVSVA